MCCIQMSKCKREEKALLFQRIVDRLTAKLWVHENVGKHTRKVNCGILRQKQQRTSWHKFKGDLIYCGINICRQSDRRITLLIIMKYIC